MPSLSDLQRVPLQEMPEGWGRLGDLADAGNAQTLGQRINFPGSNPQQGPSMWDRMMQYFMSTKDQPQAAPQAAPSSGPYIDPEKARQFQKGFFGK